MPDDATEVAEASLERDDEGDVEQYVCGNCGDAVARHEKHPVVAQSGGASVVLFCGSACRSTWIASEVEDG